MKKNKSQTIMLVIICVLAIMVAVVGGTYAWFSAIITGNAEASSIIVTAADVGTITFLDGNEISESNFKPGTTISKEFIINSSDNTIAVPYVVYLDIYENSFVQTYANELTFSLENIIPGAGIPIPDAFGEITPNIASSTTPTTLVLGSGTLAVNTDSVKYKLTVSLNEMSSVQNSNMGKRMYAKIRVSNTLSATP